MKGCRKYSFSFDYAKEYLDAQILSLLVVNWIGLCSKLKTFCVTRFGESLGTMNSADQISALKALCIKFYEKPKKKKQKKKKKKGEFAINYAKKVKCQSPLLSQVIQPSATRDKVPIKMPTLDVLLSMLIAGMHCILL